MKPIFNDSAIAYGGIYVLVTCLVAVVSYIALIPIWEALYPILTALDPTNHHATMHARLLTGYDLWLILPVISIVLAIIFFAMRAIRRQAYTAEYEDEGFR